MTAPANKVRDVTGHLNIERVGNRVVVVRGGSRTRGYFVGERAAAA